MSGIANFVRSHRKWLTVIGGVTLFLTFLVKEGFREKAKDQLAAIVTAQSQFRQSSNYRHLLEAIDRGPHTLGTVDAQGPIQTTLQAFTVANGYHTDSHNDELSDTEELANSMPANADLIEKRKAVTVEIDKIDEMFAKFSDGMRREKEYDPSTPAERKLVNDMSDQQAEVENALMAYTNSVFEIAQKRHECLERRYERFTFASYFLFSFGLLVSILGKLLEPSEEPLEVDT